MKNCFDAMRRTTRYLCVTAILSVSLSACTSVDDSLGLNFLPDSFRPAFAVDTVYSIDAYLTQTNKIPSNNLGVTFLGNTLSDTYGKTTASALMQYVPGAFTDTENRFGPSPKADSIQLNLYVGSYSGDSSMTLTYNIYEVNKPIAMDSTYYVDFPAEEVIDQEPLFTFTHKAGEHFLITLKAEESGEKGRAFMQRLADAPASVYEADTAFLSMFNGLYIAPAPADTETDAALSSITLEESYMTLYTHFRDTETDKDSTVSLSYYFDDGTYSYNTSISRILHDYAGTEIETLLNDTLPSDNPVSTAYVQTLAGVTTYLRFSERLKSEIEALRDKHGEEYRNASMVINQARLIVEMDEPQPPLTWAESMDKAPSRLGMFFNYSDLDPIPDYYYQYEQQQGGTLAYDGYLNRSNYYYLMDITNYIQKMVIGWQPGHTAQQETVYLTPDVSLTYTFGQVALRSPATGEGRMKLILTYTLMK